MSYILDALRRADAERERGHVPDLHAQPAWTAPTPGGAASGWNAARPRQAVTVGVILLLLLMLGGLAWRAFTADSGDGVAAMRPPQVERPAPTALSTPTPTPTPAPAPMATPMPTQETAQAPAGDVTLAAPPPPVDRPVVRKPLVAAGLSASGRTAMIEPPKSQRAPAAAVPASAPGKVLSIDELPEEVRRELPKLAIGGSIYSESPASRFVIVNGQLFHEGDTLAPGLVLQQIRLKSAVLGFRGYRYGISY